MRWDTLMLCSTLYTCITVPYRMALDAAAEGSWLAFEMTLDMTFSALLAPIYI